MEDIPLHMIVAMGGFVIGIIFGVTMHRSNFCMMGGVADLTLNGDTRRFRAWLFAIGIAIFGTQALHVIYTGAQINFGVAVVFGVLAGTVLSAHLNGTFRWQAFEDIHDLARYIAGGALMGIGGVTALGCTVGQGITGVSTLSLSSFVACIAIISGAVIGVRYLEQGSMSNAVRAIMNRATY